MAYEFHCKAWYENDFLIHVSYGGAVLVVHSGLPPYIMTHHIHKYHVDFQSITCFCFGSMTQGEQGKLCHMICFFICSGGGGELSSLSSSSSWSFV